MPPVTPSLHIGLFLSKEIGKVTAQIEDLSGESNQSVKLRFVRDVQSRLRSGALDVPVTDAQFAEILISIDCFCDRRINEYRHHQRVSIEDLILLVNSFKRR